MRHPGRRLGRPADDRLSEKPLQPRSRVPAADGVGGRADALRVAYRPAPRHRGARPRRATSASPQSSAELADFAVGTLGAALRIARADVEPGPARAGSASSRWASAVGTSSTTCSDVDVIFVAEPVDGARRADRPGRDPAGVGQMRLCREHTGEGAIWPVDANLRPEGKDGPLVRTLEPPRYYERWAETWEFQALLKARPRPATRSWSASTSTRSRRWCGRPAAREDFVEDSERCGGG